MQIQDAGAFGRVAEKQRERSKPHTGTGEGQCGGRSASKHGTTRCFRTCTGAATPHAARSAEGGALGVGCGAT